MINQKGIDPASLDLLAKEGILALRCVLRVWVVLGWWVLWCVEEGGVGRWAHLAAVVPTVPAEQQLRSCD